MKLILSGGGDGTQSIKVDTYYRSLNPGRKTIAYIPHAIASSDWEKAEEWLLQRPALEGLTVRPVKDLANVDVAELTLCHSIFIMGGNTFTLLDCFRKTGFASTLVSIVDEVLIYGISAGAIVLGHDIQSAEIGPDADVNTVGLMDLAGVNLLQEYNIHAHFTPDQSDILTEMCKKSNHACIALSERAGVYVNGRIVTNIGADEIVIVYPSGHSVSLGEGDTVTLAYHATTA